MFVDSAQGCLVISCTNMYLRIVSVCGLKVLYEQVPNLLTSHDIVSHANDDVLLKRSAYLLVCKW